MLHLGAREADTVWLKGDYERRGRRLCMGRCMEMAKGVAPRIHL